MRRPIAPVLLLAGCIRSGKPPPPPEPSPPRVVMAPVATTPLAARTTAASPDPPPPGACDPYAELEDRQAGDLFVPARPTRDLAAERGGRLRSHVRGRLDANSPDMWVGPPVPLFVPLTDGRAELLLLDEADDLLVATYRDPYEAGGCTLRAPGNCDVVVRAFDRCGAPRWRVRLNDHMSRPDHLEVQDVRLEDGTLYFNEACQSYSREAKGRCSALVALDPAAGALRWRTPHLVSNGRLLLDGAFVVTIYGFSQERPHVHVVRKLDGKVLLKQRIEPANWDLRAHEDGHLQVAAFGDIHHHYERVGWDGDRPQLRRVRD